MTLNAARPAFQAAWPVAAGFAAEHAQPFAKSATQTAASRAGVIAGVMAVEKLGRTIGNGHDKLVAAKHTAAAVQIDSANPEIKELVEREIARRIAAGELLSSKPATEPANENPSPAPEVLRPRRERKAPDTAYPEPPPPLASRPGQRAGCRRRKARPMGHTNR